jgi:hypothetical protein
MEASSRGAYGSGEWSRTVIIVGVDGMGWMNRLRRARGWVLYYVAAAIVAAHLGAESIHAQVGCAINGDAMGCSWILSPCPYPCLRMEYVEQWPAPDCEGTATCQHGTCVIFDVDTYSGQCWYLCYWGDWTRCKLTWDV